MNAGVRFVGVLGMAALALGLGFRDEILGSVLVAWRIEVARVVLTLIQAAGMEASREMSAIYHPGGFAYQISRGCTGVIPAAMLAVAVTAFPAAARSKLVGVGVGVPLLLGINLVRLVHLFYLGAYQPRWFHVAHTVVWEAVIIAAVVGLWLAWTLWADRVAPNGQPRSQHINGH